MLQGVTMKVDQIVWQVKTYSIAEKFIFHKGITVELGHPDHLTLIVQPLARYGLTIVERLDSNYLQQQVHGWFGTKGEAIKAAEVICRREAHLGHTGLDNTLAAKLSHLNDLQETINDDV
jgi:hypothetical protein